MSAEMQDEKNEKEKGAERNRKLVVGCFPRCLSSYILAKNIRILLHCFASKFISPCAATAYFSHSSPNLGPNQMSSSSLYETEASTLWTLVEKDRSCTTSLFVMRQGSESSHSMGTVASLSA